MNTVILIILSISIAFISFAIGRLTDKWGGHYPTPHHWIYGFGLMAGGGLFHNTTIGILAFSFGIGMFVSDLEDFIHFKLWTRDNKEGKWRFWHID